jgi:hypothetical protein
VTERRPPSEPGKQIDRHRQHGEDDNLGGDADLVGRQRQRHQDEGGRADNQRAPFHPIEGG